MVAAEPRSASRSWRRHFCRFSYRKLAQRSELNLDIFWLKHDSLEDIDSLPTPNVLTAETVANLVLALELFRHDSQERVDDGG